MVRVNDISWNTYSDGLCIEILIDLYKSGLVLHIYFLALSVGRA